MKLSELKIKNYKGILDLKIEFQNQNLLVIIGENGAGKSSLLEALNKTLSELDYNLNGVKRQHLTYEEININANETECELSARFANNTELIWKFNRSKEVNSKQIVKYFTAFHETTNRKAALQKDNFLKILYQFYGQPNINERKPIYLYFNSEYSPNADSFIQWYKDLVLFESFLKNNVDKLDFSLKEAVELAIKKSTGILITSTIADNFKTIKPVFQKNGDNLDFTHLSDGEKRIIDIIGKIVSYFITSFQSNKKKLLDFQGIVLIDEIEKHLHPKWQRNIIPELLKTFPNIQFIITTHSPQVITNVPRDSVAILDNFKLKDKVPHTLGRDINSILFDLFNLTKRPESFQMKINEIYEYLDKEEINKAKKELDEIILDLGENDLEVKRIQTQINLLELE